MGYRFGIPDAAPVRLEQSGRVPSYRQICIAIMKNDRAMLGFDAPKCEAYFALKKEELILRGRKIWNHAEQLRLF